MASENQNEYFNWPTSSTIDGNTLQRISIDDLVQQQGENQDSPQSQEQSLNTQMQNIANHQMNISGNQSQTETILVDTQTGQTQQVVTIEESMSNSPTTVASSSTSGGTQQAVLPLGIVNPDAILPTNRTYTCRICQVTFPNKSAVTVHSRLHTNHEGKPFRCHFCNKGFSTNFYLKQHERIHNGQKPYKCPMCERSFKQLSHVQQHVRTHTGVRPYKCHWPGCGKAFLQQSHLKSHVARHTPKPSNGLRPFKCHWPDCGKSFAQLNNLKSHIARHQPKTKKKPSVEEDAPSAEQITIQVKTQDGDNGNPEDSDSILTIQNVIGQAAAAANIMPDAPPEMTEGETIRPFLCPGCSKLYVREATFKKHLEECKTKLQLSISATAAALGIEPPAIPMMTFEAATESAAMASEMNAAAAASEKPAPKKRRLSKNVRKTSQNQQQEELLQQQQQQLIRQLPIEVTLSDNGQQIVQDNANDVQVKQEVITITTDGSGLIQGNNEIYKFPQVLEGHGILNSSIVFNHGTSGSLVVTAPMNNNENLFTVSSSNPNIIHPPSSFDSTLSEHQLLTSTPSPISVSSSSNSATMSIMASQTLTTSHGLLTDSASVDAIAKIEEKEESIPGHSTINQAALRWQWDQPVRLNFP